MFLPFGIACPSVIRQRSGGVGAISRRERLLQWRPAGSDAAIKGYAILMRPTTAPFWEREIYVGKVTTYTFKDVSVDDVRFGVKAIGADGTESIVSPYAYPPRLKATYDATYFQ